LGRDPVCPECGDPLSSIVDIDAKTKEIRVKLFCEGAGDDKYRVDLFTGITNKDLKGFTEVGKVVTKEMKAKLVWRKAEPSYDE